jgi:hypothetical protein
MDELEPTNGVGRAADEEAADPEGVDAEADPGEPPLAPGESDLADAWWAL